MCFTTRPAAEPSWSGIYDDAGATGIGLESFDFISASFVFSAGTAALSGTTHHTIDMFGVLLNNGLGSDLLNRNNTESNGQSKLIFQNAANTMGFGIYMSDTSSQLFVEGFFVVNHQNPERHFLTAFSAPVPVPEPVTAVLLSMGLCGVARKTRAGARR